MTLDQASHSSASNPVADALRQAISQGELAPDQRLVETDLSDRYQATRSVVREALTQLSVEGLVEKVQNRGARVRAISISEAVEIIDVRAALEALCVRKAAERIDDGQILELQQLGSEMSEAVAAGELGDYSTINSLLHRRIIEISSQKTAAATVERLRVQGVRYQYRLALQPGRAAVSLQEHLEIIEALVARDAEKAAKSMEAHMGSVAHAIRHSAGG